LIDIMRCLNRSVEVNPEKLTCQVHLGANNERIFDQQRAGAAT
jgi:hypothetical protein